MAVIGKIRSYSGLLVIVVGVALAAFVLGDFLRQGPSSGRSEFGEIAGEQISYIDFEKEAEELMSQRQQQVQGGELLQMRNELWDKKVREIIQLKEYQALGLAVEHNKAVGPAISKEELQDMVFGKNPSQQVMQYFASAMNGGYNPEFVSNYLNQIDQLRNTGNAEQRKMAAEEYSRWQFFKNYLRSSRLSEKYNALISKANYTPKVLAKKDYEDANRKCTFRYFSLKYNSITDSIVVTDKELKAYYEAHESEYEQDASRDLEYVIWDVQPSADDFAEARRDINDIKKGLATVEDIASYVNANSDKPYDSTFFKQGDLPVMLDTLLFKAGIGQVFGPMQERNTFYLAKLIERMARPDSMQAKHILVAYDEAYGSRQQRIARTKEQAQARADSILSVLKRTPGKFEELADQLSDDPSAKENKGDLDWFADGAMVYPFNKACFENPKGSIVIAETMFGFHVIQVTNKTAYHQKARAAIIEVNVLPSNMTFQDNYAKASAFSSGNRTYKAFDAAVAQEGLNKRVGNAVTEMALSLPGLQQSRELIRWAFNEETEEGAVSNVFDLDGKYVVAVVKDIREEGSKALEDVKEEIRAKVADQKKAEKLAEKIKASGAAEINGMAAAVGATVDTLDYITFSSYSLPAAGPEPKVIATLFTMQSGELSAPVAGKSGVFVMQVDNFIALGEQDDYSEFVRRKERYFANRLNYEVFNALKKNAEIVDNRRMYY